jgi:thiol:disulfide interchange protein
MPAGVTLLVGFTKPAMMGAVHRLLVSLALLASIFAVVPGFAQTSTANHIRAKLVAHSDAPIGGGVVTLAIVFTPEAGWHGYWQNPGDAGLGAQFDWTLPDGVTAGAPLYPVPERLVIAGLMNHVYEREYALIVQMKLPRGLARGTRLPIRARGEWLACTDEICVPEGGDLAIDLTVGDGAVKPETQQAFNGWWAKMPRPLGSEAVFQRDGDRVRIAIPIPAQARVESPWFYASTENAIAYAAPQRVTRDGDRLVIETRAAGKVGALNGVLSIGRDMGLAIEARPGVVRPGGTPVGDSAVAPGMSLAAILLALGGAVLGGLILNVMPCVFPIISLKALSLAKAGGDEATVKREAIAYAAGVIVTCLALGGLLLGLRAAGQTIGWAFQLQNPAILFLLLLVSVAITLNMLGVFEIGAFGGGQALAGQGGSAGAFWTGALAAFVATPCTGPFMAAALGAALILPTALGLAIFAGLGLGLALPFLLLGWIPSLRRRMPRPGPWMVRFRRIMAVPMAVTGAALVWLLWRQTGAIGLGIGLAASVLLGGLLWMLGRPNAGRKPILVAAIGALSLFGVVGLPGATQSVASTGIHDARAFDEAVLARLRAEGRPVFLYFTADWCVTCKVNEKAAIERDEVARAFAGADVVVMVGDWTNGNPLITRFLESRGRSGVPLYLWYPKEGQPRELPQVLTPGLLVGLTG